MLSLIPPAILILVVVAIMAIPNLKERARKKRQREAGKTGMHDFIGKEIVKDQLRQGSSKSRRQRRPLGITDPARQAVPETREFILVPRNGRH